MSILFWKPKLQVWHLAGLFLVPVLYAILKLNSEPQDSVAQQLGSALFIFAIIWGAYVVVMTVRHGDRDAVLKNLFSEYRRQLGHMPFLIVANVILTVLAGFLVYQLIFFRQVEFTFPTEVELMLNDTVGHPQVLGIIKENQPTKYRLRVGERLLAYKQVKNGRLIALKPLRVPFVWSKDELPLVKVKTEEHIYVESPFRDEPQEQK